MVNRDWCKHDEIGLRWNILIATKTHSTVTAFDAHHIILDEKWDRSKQPMGKLSCDWQLSRIFEQVVYHRIILYGFGHRSDQISWRMIVLSFNSSFSEKRKAKAMKYCSNNLFLYLLSRKKIESIWNLKTNIKKKDSRKMKKPKNNTCNLKCKEEA